MTGSTERAPFARVAAVLCAAVLTLGLAACAPEPSEMPVGKPSPDAQQEPSWPEGQTPDVEKSATLPESFPNSFVPLPANAEIDDAGERDEGAWFVVLRADSLESAGTMLDQIANDGGFVVTDNTETGEGGRSATLTVDGYLVNALTLTEGKQALLSLDVTSTLL